MHLFWACIKTEIKLLPVFVVLIMFSTNDILHNIMQQHNGELPDVSVGSKQLCELNESTILNINIDFKMHVSFEFMYETSCYYIKEPLRLNLKYYYIFTVIKPIVTNTRRRCYWSYIPLLFPYNCNLHIFILSINSTNVKEIHHHKIPTNVILITYTTSQIYRMVWCSLMITWH